MKTTKKRWYKALMSFIKIFHKKSIFVYLGEKLQGPSIILSNHVGASGPLSLGHIGQGKSNTPDPLSEHPTFSAP